MRTFTLVISSLILVACGGGGSAGSQPSPLPPPPPLPAAPIVNVEVGLKQLIFSWEAVSGATIYRLLENPDGHSGFTQVGDDIPAGTLSVTRPIAVHLHDFTNALYVVEACNATGCNSSTEVHSMDAALDAIGYFKASNTDMEDLFGDDIALSADGRTLAAGAIFERSSATGINGDQNDNSTFYSGAVYLFRFDGTAWSQEAYIKASNTGAADWFGRAVALSQDGNTLAVGAPSEDSGATGVNGDQSDDSALRAGAAYVFRFDGTEWLQEAYIKASNTGPQDSFGGDVALSEDGNTLAVGATGEDSSATGVNGDQDDNSAARSGAAYVFRFDGTEWLQEAYFKASNTEGALDPSAPNDDRYGDQFGGPIELSGNGNTLVVGARREDSSATGVNGDQNDNSADYAGAVYLFRFDGTEWSQQAYIKASNTGQEDRFGSIAISNDGNTLAVGAPSEDSNATGINGDQDDNSLASSGAAYLFRFDGTEWSQEAYIKASDAGGVFGGAIALSNGGSTLAVGAHGEDSSATGVNGDQDDNTAQLSGATYVFRFDGTEWSQQAFIKASNTGAYDRFGTAVELSEDSSTLAVAARREASNATGIGGDQNDNSAAEAGAVYLY